MRFHLRPFPPFILSPKIVLYGKTVRRETAQERKEPDAQAENSVVESWRVPVVMLRRGIYPSFFYVFKTHL